MPMPLRWDLIPAVPDAVAGALLVAFALVGENIAGVHTAGAGVHQTVVAGVGNCLEVGEVNLLHCGCNIFLFHDSQ